MISPECHGVHGVKDGVAAHQFVVELVVARRRRQERVPVRHEQVENDDDLEANQTGFSEGASRYDVRIGWGRGSWKSGRSKGGCVNFVV